MKVHVYLLIVCVLFFSPIWFNKPSIIETSKENTVEPMEKIDHRVSDTLATYYEDKLSPNVQRWLSSYTGSFDTQQTPSLEEQQEVDIIVSMTKSPLSNLLTRFQSDYNLQIQQVYTHAIQGFSATVPLDKVVELTYEPSITFIEDDPISHAHLDESTVNFGARSSPYVWDAPTPIKGNPNYSIAVLDSGIDSTHTDFENFLYFHDFTDENYPNGTTGVDYDHHGTHVASIAAGTGKSDQDTSTVNQSFSYRFPNSTGSYFPEWFEIKDHETAPSTSATMVWDTSSGGSVTLGLVDSDDYLIDSIESSTSPITLDFGSQSSGWYQLYCSPASSEAYNKEYTAWVEHEYEYYNESLAAKPVFSGVAPQSNVVALKVLDDTGAGQGSWLLDALDWIAQYGKSPKYNITTVTMSLGFDQTFSSIDTAVNQLVEQGFVCVASAGNDGTNGGDNTVHSPGSADKCITVGAVNNAFEVTYYSSNGDETMAKPDIVAPGGTRVFDPAGTDAVHNLILAADSNNGEYPITLPDSNNNDYRGFQGTSMAAPHVAGLAQLLIDATIQQSGTAWTWSESKALTIKQLICQATWEVNNGETYDEGDGIPQDPPLDRVGADTVEGYGMTRADAAIQAITSTFSEINNTPFYLDRRSGEYAHHPKVRMFQLSGNSGDVHTIYVSVPATGDFDLLIYDQQYDSATGRPILLNSSISAGLDVDENIIFTLPSTGTYYVAVRAVEGYGDCIVSSTANKAPTIANATPSGQTKLTTSSPTLQVEVSDPDGDPLDVCFYNAEDDTLIGKVANTTQTTISIVWSDLELDKEYSWYVKVNDTITAASSPTWFFTVYDNPMWVTYPTNQVVTYGEPFNYQLEATDATGIVDYTVNLTYFFSVNATGLLTNAISLTPGVYSLLVSAYDRLNNQINASFTVTVSEESSTASSTSFTSSLSSSSSDSDTLTSEPLYTTFITIIPLSLAILALVMFKKRKLQ